MAQYLVDPLPSDSVLAKEEYIASRERVGKVTLGCFKSSKTSRSPTVCLAKELPAIRVEFSRDGFVMLFNKIVQLDGHYAAEQLQVGNSDLAIVDADVVTLEGLSKIDDSEFTPPASARTSLVHGGGDATIVHWVGGFAPRYPEMARKANVDGTVVVSATITKTGVVKDVEVISGPRLLRSAALEAVKTWKYTPYMVDGEPAELRTRVDVVFQHGR